SHPAILQGGQVEKGRSAAKDDTASYQAALLLEEDLGGAQGHDAGQRPALDRENAIDGAGCQDQRIEGISVRPSLAEHVQLALMGAPHQRVRLVVDMGPDLLERVVHPFVFDGLAPQEGSGGKPWIQRKTAIGLAACPTPFIDETGPDAALNENGRCRYAGS